MTDLNPYEAADDAAEEAIDDFNEWLAFIDAPITTESAERFIDVKDGLTDVQRNAIREYVDMWADQ